MVKIIYKQLILYASLFLLLDSANSSYENPNNFKSISYLFQNFESNPKKNGITDSLKLLDSNDITIDINEEGNNTYNINPKANYKFILNENLTHFFICQSDDIIIYNSNLDYFPKLCVFDKYKTPVFVNNTLEEEIELKVVSLKMKSNAFSGKVESPRFSGIRPMKKSQIYIYQLTKDNYFYSDSFDKSSRFFYAEYRKDMNINDIKNINADYFKEGSGEIIHLEKNKIYIGIFLQEFSFSKIYFYDKLPENIQIIKKNIKTLYLEKNTNYTLDFSNNTTPYIIKLNPKIDSTLYINNSQINQTNKYFYTSNYNETIKVSTGDKDALIEVLYSNNEEGIDIINNKDYQEYTISKNNAITLIEYIPSDDNRTNLEIYINSKDNFKLWSYGGLSKENYSYYSNNYYSYDNKEKYYFIRINSPLKDILLEPEEKYYISLIFMKSNPEQEIKISLTNYENIIETLYEPIDNIYIDNVISNLTDILQNYIFLDIIKNPPAPEGHPNYVHEPIHLIDNLNNINRSNRKFYDFYQEIRKDLGAPRNLQLRIYGLFSTKNTKISYMTACLPFSFYVDKDNNKEAKLYIKYFDDCAPYFKEEIRIFVKDKAEKKIV